MGNVRVTGWLVLNMAVLATGCSRQDTERLARIGKHVAAHAETFTANCNAELGSSWSGAGKGVGARVSARLRWDSSLAGLTIEVHATGGTVELKGTVRNLAQRRRAVELAESTTGVEKVNDHLQVAEH